MDEKNTFNALRRISKEEAFLRWKNSTNWHKLEGVPIHNKVLILNKDLVNTGWHWIVVPSSELILLITKEQFTMKLVEIDNWDN